jgi:DNA-binding NarL/FixJ family response regulator
MGLKIAIGCCNRLFSEAIACLMEGEQDIEIINVFYGNSNLANNLQHVLKSDLDVIISDFSTFNGNVNILNALYEDFDPDNKLKILLIGDRALRLIADHHLTELIKRGVVGILPTSADSTILKKAVRAVSSGELWVDKETLVKILSSIKNPEKHRYLAKREREIVLHICQGYRNKEIAQKLKISEQTVKSYCHRIYKKVGVSDRLQLVLHSYSIMP